MLRIDTHHHAIPSEYRNLLRKAGIEEAGGREVPEWSPEGSAQAMSELAVGTAILSVSAPGTTFLPNPADAAALARVSTSTWPPSSPPNPTGSGSSRQSRCPR